VVSRLHLLSCSPKDDTLCIQPISGVSRRCTPNPCGGKGVVIGLGSKKVGKQNGTHVSPAATDGHNGSRGAGSDDGTCT
jgi:hypothetical protein